jgi:hypothetical protein
MNNLNLIYKNFNILNYNEITRNIEHWNPYEVYYNIIFFTSKKCYFILGPENDKKLRYLWKFNIRYNNEELKLYSTENSINTTPCINITIKDKVGKIDYINQCGDYTGRNLIEWMLEIMKKLYCEKCILNDQAEKKCNKRKKTNYVSLSLIHKLCRGETYYEYFGFSPYNIENSSYENNKILELNNLINNLKKLTWNDFSIVDEDWILFKNKYSIIYNSPFLSFKEFTNDNCNIFYDMLHHLDKYDQPSSESLNNVKKIISKSIWMKIL